MRNPNVFPVNLKLAGRRVIITGRDEEVWRRLEQFVGTGARFFVFYEGCKSSIPRSLKNHVVLVFHRLLQPEDLDDTFLLVSTFGKGPQNEVFFQWTRQRKVLMYAVDDPEHSDLTLSAIGRRGLITVAVSTNGASPLVAARIRDRCLEVITDADAKLVSFLARIRPRVQQELATFETRRRFYRRVVESDIRGRLSAGDLSGARARFEELLEDFRNKEEQSEG